MCHPVRLEPLKITSGTKFFEAASANDDTSNTNANAAAECLLRVHIAMPYPSLLVKLTMAGSIYEQRMCSQRKRPRFLQSLLKRWYTHAGMDRVQRLVIAALVLMAGIYLVGVRYHNRERSNGNVHAPQTASRYVDSAVCAECHSEIATTYRLTGMARSFYRPRSENVPEDYKVRNSFYHQASDRYYTMLERAGEFFQRRHQIGFGGGEDNVVEVAVDFVIGSGNHARSYLHRTA